MFLEKMRSNKKIVPGIIAGNYAKNILEELNISQSKKAIKNGKKLIEFFKKYKRNGE